MAAITTPRNSDSASTPSVAAPVTELTTPKLLSQREKVWRRFLRRRVAVVGGMVVLALYLAAACADFLAPYTRDERFVQYLYAPPQLPKYDPQIGLYVNGLVRETDLETLRTTYTPDESVKAPIHFFVKGQPYKLLGLIPSDVHLFGLAEDFPNRQDYGFFPLGADRQGRDMLSRLLLGAQMSLTIGLVGVFISLIIGSVMGVVSGFYSGRVDNLIQRLIEIIRAFPAVPLWMALTAALPQNWSPEQIYFSITLILSLIAWTWLARQLRGKVLSLRSMEFVQASIALGADDRRVIFKHLIPAVFGHIIVIASLAMPAMILAESALSFLNLGLRAPLVSWGILLQDAQNLETLRLFPWLLLPAVFISVTVLAFNFLGDGLRDATDPYTV
jgi:peptide/nickel transport system permease protein